MQAGEHNELLDLHPHEVIIVAAVPELVLQLFECPFVVMYFDAFLTGSTRILVD